MAQRDTALDEEPIFWTSTRPGFNDSDRNRPRMRDGKRIVEKHPQIGHVGDIKEKRRAKFVRFIYMIRHDGNEVPIVMTNAAAHTDSTGPWGQYQLLKARFLGWFPTGECPCALLTTGRLKAEHMVCKDLVGAEPCAPFDATGARRYSRDQPCEHAVAEWKARQAQQAQVEAEREARAKDPNQKLIEAQHAQTDAIVAVFRDVLQANGQRSSEEIKEIARAVLSERSGKAKPDKGGEG